MLARAAAASWTPSCSIFRGATMQATAAAAGRVVEDADAPAKLSDYVVCGNLRLVLPYYFDFKCHVKARMLGRTIIDAFCTEFPSLSREYYEQAFQDGRLRVDGRQLGLGEPLRSGDCIRHFIHRHEPPALAGSIQVLAQTTDIVAVHKPGGMPVHVAGQYRKNTVLGVLQAERPELQPLLVTHRLDRPVSGLLLLARSKQAASRMCELFMERDVSKAYLARVAGSFPAGAPLLVDVPLAWDHKGNHCHAVPQQQQQQQQQQQPDHTGDAGAGAGAAAAAAAPPAAAPPPAAPPRAKLQAKPAATEFELLHVAPDGLTSVVACRPRTGRTHQIRVHLQHLGFPIANDRQYGGHYGVERVLGSRARAAAVAAAAGRQGGSAAAADGAGSDAAAEDGEQAQEQGRCKRARADNSAQQAAAAAAGAGGATGPEQQRQQQPELLVPPELHDPLCMHCPSLPPSDYPLDLEPLWLHCHSYSSEEWSFSCPPPAWAEQGFVPEPPAPAS